MELHFFLRMPKFPMIIVRGDALYSAKSQRSLAKIVFLEIQDVRDEKIVFIESTGQEFFYHDGAEALNGAKALMPNIIPKPWTKKKLIELYNSSANAGLGNTSYPEKSLSSRTYQKIFNELAELIRRNPP